MSTAVLVLPIPIARGKEPEPTHHRVEIRRFRFEPATITIRRNDTIEWINRDLAPHTATARDRSWDTFELAREETARVRFEAPGRHPYFCRFHPHMKGTVIVVSEPSDSNE